MNKLQQLNRKKWLAFFICTFMVMLISGCKTQEQNHKLDTTVAWLVIIGLIIFLFVLATLTNMLRDEIGDCDEYESNVATAVASTNKLAGTFKRPFSFSRSQLAVWTIVIASTYIYEVFVRDCESKELNSTAIILMGISTGTIAIAGLIDKKQIESGETRHQDTPSKGFFTDILSDENGISIHRFQNFIWTVIAMVIYLHKVVMNDLEANTCFPELSQTLLTLTGISSATYLTLKGKENTNPASTNTPPGDGDKPTDKPDKQPDIVVVAPGKDSVVTVAPAATSEETKTADATTPDNTDPNPVEVDSETTTPENTPKG